MKPRYEDWFRVPRHPAILKPILILCHDSPHMSIVDVQLGIIRPASSSYMSATLHFSCGVSYCQLRNSALTCNKLETSSRMDTVQACVGTFPDIPFSVGLHVMGMDHLMLEPSTKVPLFVSEKVT